MGFIRIRAVAVGMCVVMVVTGVGCWWREADMRVRGPLSAVLYQVMQDRAQANRTRKCEAECQIARDELPA